MSCTRYAFYSYFRVYAMNNQKPTIITLSSDFEKQSQGVGNMEGVIYAVNPNAHVIHLMHGIKAFDIISAARTMETIVYMPIGFHVCVVDPGVGTKRRPIIVKVKRGDYFIGPDNGCLMSTPSLLGGIEKIVEITNKKYLLAEVSNIFHGRDVFAPVAAHLSKGVPIEEFGKEIAISSCISAPYKEATLTNGSIRAIVIHMNHFGSIHLNILQNEWDKLRVKLGDSVVLSLGKKKVTIPFFRTFGDVPEGSGLIMKDDYKRMEVAINQGSFAEKYKVNVGDKITITKK